MAIKPYRAVRDLQAQGVCAWFKGVLMVGLLSLVPLTSQAQSAIQVHERAIIEHINEASQVAPLTNDNAFGDQINTFNGSLSFRNTDISLRGNNALPVELTRRLDVDDRSRGTGMHLGGFGQWDIDLPQLYGMFSTSAGWRPASGTVNQRCSLPDAPPSVVGLQSFDYWDGYFLNTGSSTSTLLANPKAALGASSSYKWVTKDLWLISCKSTTSNGYPGEAFIATSPTGLKYYLDWGVAVGNQAPVKSPYSNSAGGGTPIARQAIHFLVSRIEDRFGNWVTFSYSGSQLTSINSSDGRAINLTWGGGRVTSVTANGRTWTYGYDPYGWLISVTQPDGSVWGYGYNGSLAISPAPWAPMYEDPTGCPESIENPTGAFTISVVTPSKATGVFQTQVQGHFRTNTPDYCYVYMDSYWRKAVPDTSWSLTLYRKQISGPGISTATWDYAYEGASSLYLGDAKENTVSTAGKFIRYTYGTSFNENEGQLLESGIGSSSSDIKKSTTYFYVTNAEAAGQAFPPEVGDVVVGMSDQLSTQWLRPLKQQVTIQDGVTFNWQVNGGCGSAYCFDVYAQPKSVHKWSSLGYGRNDVTEYYNDAAHWVLGQIKRHYNADTNLVDTRNEYDANTALVLQTYAFEKLKATMTYNADGTLATSKDGNNNTTTFSNWKRGIPQNIQYADGTSISAIVNDNGWITAVTDENGYSTGYGYDAMGRVAAITYPNETNLNYNNTTITFAPTTISAYGLPAGYWQQITTTGNRKKVVYFDGLWRPVVEESYDTGNVGGTLSQLVKRYDADGRVTFQSLPQRTQDANVYNTWGNPAVTPNATGIKTVYDALGRVTQAQQDSELGALTTTTEYLTGFQIRTTNPRGYKTTNGYEVYDQPSYDQLAWSAQPENKDVTITRNYFGLPLTITQSDHANTAVSVTRKYLYTPAMELCRTIEPEVSNTFMGYDDAGNLAWSATGYPTTTEPACTESQWVAANRVDRTYDARNRLLTLSFPDGVGNQSWQYTPDGLASQITTYNEANNGAPVVNAYHYNKRRLLDGSGESVSQDGWYTWAIGHGYDANASLTTEVYPGSEQVNYAPNALGQPTQVASQIFTYATGVTYYPNGGISQFTYGNGIVHTMTQNARQLPSRSIDAGVINYGFTYDANANPTAISDDQQGTGYNRTMTYDGLDRLITAQSGAFGGTDQAHRFSYDALDNIKSWKLAGVKDYASYIYDASNRLTQINTTAGAAAVTLSYDVRGNLASKGSQNYYFDYGNRLRWANGQESYRYDGHGRRVSSFNSWPAHVAILSMYDAGGMLRYQRDERQNKVMNYMYLGGSLVAYRETTLADMVHVAKYQHTDALGSPVAITDQSGQVIERTNYEPYGGVIGKPNNDRPGYTGHVMDSQTGLTYMQQRYYDPTIGRFLSTDPVVANANTGASFNRYAYALNNPYRFTDPDGRCPIPGSSYCGKTIETLQAESAAQYRSEPTLLGKLLGIALDFTPIVGDFVGVQEVINEPSWRGAAAAGIGFVPIIGDAAGKALKNADHLIEAAGKLERLKGGVREGRVQGDANAILGAITDGGKKGAGGRVTMPDGTIIGSHASKSTGQTTIDINKGGQVYKIRVEPPPPPQKPKE